MPVIRVVSISLVESEFRVEGDYHFSVMEKEEGGFLRSHIDLSFYRPGKHLSDRDWLKDMLVQVIEQL